MILFQFISTGIITILIQSEQYGIVKIGSKIGIVGSKNGDLSVLR